MSTIQAKAESTVTETPSPGLGLKRIPHLWFDDGTVVLRAGNSLYRVYWDMLRSVSTLFKDGPDVLPLGPGEKEVDGCPYVDVQAYSSSDEALAEEDVTVVLDLLFNGSTSFFSPSPPSSPPPKFAFLCSVIRGSAFFGIPHLQTRALSFLSHWIALSLPEHDRIQQSLKVPVKAEEEDLGPEEWLAAYRIARKCGYDWILAYSFYRLVTAYTDIGDLIALLSSSSHPSSPPLSITDERALYKAHPSLTSKSRSHILHPLTQECAQGFLACAYAKLRCLKECEDGGYDALSEQIMMAVERYGAKKGMRGPCICRPCVGRCREGIKDGRREVWEGILGEVRIGVGIGGEGEGGWEALEGVRQRQICDSDQDQPKPDNWTTSIQIFNGTYTSPSPSPSPSPSSSPQPQRVPHLWYADGTIVFRAGNSLYRVYKGLLSARSSFFRDMFSLPQPSEQPEETMHVDGCQVVQLPDEQEDITPFFDCIFNPVSKLMTTPISTSSNPSYTTLTHLLTLSTKYDVPHLRHRTLLYLQRWFPTDIHEFDDEGHRFLIGKVDENLEAVALGSVCDVPWILPAALYRISHALASGSLTISTLHQSHDQLESSLLQSDEEDTTLLLLLTTAHTTLCEHFIHSLHTFLTFPCVEASAECREAKLRFFGRYSDVGRLERLEDGVLSRGLRDRWDEYRWDARLDSDVRLGIGRGRGFMGGCAGGAGVSLGGTGVDASDKPAREEEGDEEGARDIEERYEDKAKVGDGTLEEVDPDIEIRTCYYCHTTGRERLWQARMGVVRMLPGVFGVAESWEVLLRERDRDKEGGEGGEGQGG